MESNFWPWTEESNLNFFLSKMSIVSRHVCEVEWHIFFEWLVAKKCYLLHRDIKIYFCNTFQKFWALRNQLNNIKCKEFVKRKISWGAFHVHTCTICHLAPMTKAHLGSKVNALDPLTISWSCNVWAVRVWASYSDVLTVSLHPSISEEDSNIQWWIRPTTKAAIFISVCAIPLSLTDAKSFAFWSRPCWW